ncbi:MAG: thioredoxin family protein [Bacteroidetes bacterium]|nr:thioredoxin family protein [Bacteroidota bacterium]
MVCDSNECLPPDQKEFTLDLKDRSIKFKGAFKPDTTVAVVVGGKDFWPPLKECIKIEEEPKDTLTFFFLGILGGLIALLTPCVFPMIPLTVSFFTKKEGTKRKGILNAFLYGFCIVLIYFLLSMPFMIFDDISPDILNEISTNVWLNLSFFVIFVVFAFSFFGYFEITLPSSLANKADSASEVGGILGIFFMALTLALVSFSCTGPILGSLLVGAVSAEGGATNLVVGMTGFGFALALPFGLFAAFPTWLNSLPKSGGWLNTVKVVLGFLELALALKFFSNADLVIHWGILYREIFFIIWVLVGIGLTAYLFGWIKFPHDSPIQKLSTGRMSLAVVTLAFTLYLIPGIWGANLKLVSGFPPPMFYTLWIENENNCPHNLPCYHDYDEALVAAKEQNKPIMIDFTGWACVNCRRMEEKVWVEKEVYKRLQNDLILVSLYVDDRKPLDEEDKYVSTFTGKKIRTIGNKWADFEISYFKRNSQPYYALVSPDEKLLTAPVGYTPDVHEYSTWLDCGLSAFTELNGKSTTKSKDEPVSAGVSSGN